MSTAFRLVILLMAPVRLETGYAFINSLDFTKMVDVLVVVIFPSCGQRSVPHQQAEPGSTGQRCNRVEKTLANREQSTHGL